MQGSPGEAEGVKIGVKFAQYSPFHGRHPGARRIQCSAPSMGHRGCRTITGGWTSTLHSRGLF